MLLYGSSKPSSLSLTEASLAVRGEKLGRDPQIGQLVRWECSQESLFLRSSKIHSNLLVTHEKLLYADYVTYV
jgi:hypothetical protein